MTTSAHSVAVTVIVPMYNVQEYVRSCIESLSDQIDAPCFEVLLINDGSTDDTAQICQQFLSDPRISYYSKENGGLSSARNFGLERAIGRYVVFVDSDDVVDPRFVATLFNSAIEHAAEIAVVGFEQCSDHSHYLTAHRKIGQTTIFSPEEATKELLLSRALTVSACAKLAKRELWSAHPFPEGAVYEDLATTIKVVGHATRVAVVDGQLYGQLNRAGSITRSETYSPQKLSNYLDALESCTRAATDLFGTKLESAILVRRMIEYCRIKRLILDNSSTLGELGTSTLHNSVNPFLRNNLIRLLMTSSAGPRTKIQVLLATLLPRLYSTLFTALQRRKMSH